MKLILFVYILTLYSLIYTIDDKLQPDDIVFVVRADYICNGLFFKSSNKLRCYDFGQTYNFQVADLISNQQDLHAIVAQLINKKLTKYIEGALAHKGFKADNLDHLILLNKREVDQNILNKFKTQQLDQFIDAVMDNTILDKFEIITPTSFLGVFGRRATINEKTFLLLNKYLNICYQYGVYLLEKLQIKKVQDRLNIIDQIYTNLISLLKLLDNKNLSEIKNACRKLSEILGLEFIDTKARLARGSKFTLKRKINNLSNLSYSLGRLSLGYYK